MKIMSKFMSSTRKFIYIYIYLQQGCEKITGMILSVEQSQIPS